MSIGSWKGLVLNRWDFFIIFWTVLSVSQLLDKRRKVRKMKGRGWEKERVGGRE
jgi:hypothetical protein